MQQSEYMAMMQGDDGTLGIAELVGADEVRSDGKVLFPFRRTFVIVYRYLRSGGFASEAQSRELRPYNILFGPP